MNRKQWLAAVEAGCVAATIIAQPREWSDRVDDILDAEDLRIIARTLEIERRANP